MHSSMPMNFFQVITWELVVILITSADGFGEVEHDLEGTVDRIIEYMENGCQLKDKYRERIDNFFAFHDKNNCQRVYEKIKELEQ